MTGTPIPLEYGKTRVPVVLTHYFNFTKENEMANPRNVRVLAHDAFPTATLKSPTGSTTLAAGSTADIPQNVAQRSAEAVSLCLSGTTAQRPMLGDADVFNLPTPTWYIDTTLNKVIVWTGKSWRDPLTGNIA